MKKIFSLVISLFIAFNINAGDGLTISITGCVPCVSNSKIVYGADLSLHRQTTPPSHVKRN